MSTIGDVERALANLYEYRWLIGGLTIAFIAAFLAYGYWRGWHKFILRHRVAFGIASVPVLALSLWLGWSLGSPLFINVTVEEEFPFAVNAVLPEGMELADVEGVMAGMAMVDDAVMREPLPEAAVMDAGSMLAAGDAMGAMEAAADAGGEVQRLQQGDFKDADSFHRGSGQAIIYTAPGGGHLLRLENFSVTNGPALHVILSSHPDPTRADEVKQGEYLDLGRLKGNRGNQNYSIPAGVDVSAFNSVVIYCKPFSVVFSTASLQGL